MTTEQFDRRMAFIGDKTGIVLCGECVVEGCSPADIGPFTCEICGNSYPFLRPCRPEPGDGPSTRDAHRRSEHDH